MSWAPCSNSTFTALSQARTFPLWQPGAGRAFVNVGKGRRAVMAWYAKFDGVDGSSKHKDQQGGATWRREHAAATRRAAAARASAASAARCTSRTSRSGIISDKATPKLLEAAVKGKVFKKVEIHGTATYGDAGEQVYLEGRAGERADHHLPARRAGQQRRDGRSEPVAQLREVQDDVHRVRQGRQPRATSNSSGRSKRANSARRVRLRDVEQLPAAGGDPVRGRAPCGGGGGEQMRWP